MICLRNLGKLINLALKSSIWILNFKCLVLCHTNNCFVFLRKNYCKISSVFIKYYNW